MGILHDVIEKIKKRKKEASPSSYAVGVNYTGREMTYSSSIIIHQNGDEIHIGKNRISSEIGFCTLSTAMELIIREYMRSDCTDTLTPSAMFNIPIKEDLDIAIREVLVKHKILEE